MMLVLYRDLVEIKDGFDPAKKIPFGLFDAYSFVSRHMLLCRLNAIVSDVEAVGIIVDELGISMFPTRANSIQQVCAQIGWMYRWIKTQFGSILVDMEAIADSYYHEFANRLSGRYSLAGDEAFLVAASNRVQREATEYVGEGFTAFSAGCTKTVHGYLKKGAKLVTKVVDGVEMVLHSKGVWVGVSADAGILMQVVREY
jgi:hypothetical protein